ncbi:PAAR domain-containing protein [Janthinobacterium sp. GMG2]|uniref:PAAR domain-containing protein n=1 Tax=Janthinobacterium sp. GMG2 TaxID=3096606 RepID=UPI0029F52894|nr:PAAR domain-containing protein [Janthinobacterium sp. GMG2]MDX8121307.1 PAAR domain-containing protein [Janthinobacterium sp. GMG2]
MPEIIQQGDTTSHGGTVLEGSPRDLCMGKPISYLGHKVHCPKCKGIFPIVEGVTTTSFYGRGVAVAGMKTSCGAVLIASQFTDTVEWSTGTWQAAEHSNATAAAAAQLAQGALPRRSSAAASEIAESYDEQPQLHASEIGGIPYFVETKDGRRFSGRATMEGMLPRVETYNEEEYTVYWGDVALAKMEEVG